MHAVEKLIENLYRLINIFMYNDNLHLKMWIGLEI